MAVPRYIIPNIVVTDVPAPSSSALNGGIEATSPVAVMVGRLHPQKDSLRSARVLVLLASQQSDLRCKIIGQGPLGTEVADIVSTGGVSDRVKLLGYRDDAHSHIGRASALLTLSRHEGLPNVVLECAALGTPVVASDIPEHVNVLGPDYPYYVPDDASDELAASILAKALADRNPGAALAYARSRIAAMSAGQVSGSFAAMLWDVVSRVK